MTKHKNKKYKKGNNEVTPPPHNPEGGPTEMWSAPTLYSDGDVHMGNVDDSVTDNLYQ